MGSLADSQAVTALLARIYKRPPQMVGPTFLAVFFADLKSSDGQTFLATMIFANLKLCSDCTVGKGVLSKGVANFSQTLSGQWSLRSLLWS